MKQRTVRVPDEGELWLAHGHYYAVINGKFAAVGIGEVVGASNVLHLTGALKKFYDRRACSYPKIDANAYNGNGITFVNENYKDYLAKIVDGKLSIWSDHIRLATDAFTAVMKA